MTVYIVANLNWPFHQLDVENALFMMISSKKFAHLPLGFIKLKEEKNVYRLKKAINALKQSSRACSYKFSNALFIVGFLRCSSDHSVFV